MQVVWSEIMEQCFFSQNTAKNFTLDKHGVKVHLCQNHNKISNIKSEPWDKNNMQQVGTSEDLQSFSEGRMVQERRSEALKRER